MLLFLKKFNIDKYKGDNIQDYFPESHFISNLEEFDNTKNYVVCDIDNAIKLLPMVIDDYIAYGPILNKYLFIKRLK